MDDLSTQVRRIDEDRWLASRFASADVRERLIALYALNDEIARSSEVVTQPALADIRFAWWREAIAEIYAGKPPRAHPALSAFAAVFRAARWDEGAFEALIEARRQALESLASVAELEGHFDATAGRILRLAVSACGIELNAEVERFVGPAARTWGALAWLRAGRPLPDDTYAEDMLKRARAEYEAARNVPLPSGAFPATGYVALAPVYIGAIERGRRDAMLLTRQLRLIAAAATGRI